MGLANSKYKPGKKKVSWIQSLVSIFLPQP